MKVKEGIAVVGAGLVIGVGWGVGVESHTNEVAHGKVITAKYCLGQLAAADTIDKAFIECTHDGVPGGRKIGDNKFQEGEPKGFVDTYIAAQQAEASSIEPGRLVGWSVAPFGVAVGIGGWALFLG